MYLEVKRRVYRWWNSSEGIEMKIIMTRRRRRRKIFVYSCVDEDEMK